ITPCDRFERFFGLCGPMKRSLATVTVFTKESVMYFALRSSLALGIATTILASSSAALAAEKCPASNVVEVVYKNEAKSGKATKADIVDTAVKAGSLKTLAAALKAAGLVETLKGKGPFTVFAPTDKAF